MHIKRFEAASVEEAIAQVKAELGPDALILSSRTLRAGRGAFGLLSRSRIEVQAALERPVRERSSDARQAGPEDTGDANAGDGSLGSSEAEALIADLRRELAGLRRREDFEEEIRSELRELRRVFDGALGDEGTRAPDPHVAELVRAGLAPRYASSIVEEWRASGSEDSTATPASILFRRLEARLAPPRVDRATVPRIFVGAPGVGKTTTLAKLAARNEEGERDVAMVSMDSYRIGGQDQLRRYAELMETPFVEARSAHELPAIVSRHARRSVLIDTAGRGPRSEDRLDSLGALRQTLGRRVSIELVLDATARPEVQAAQLERFAPLEPDRLILAKVDECRSFREITNLLLDPTCPPLCWLGNGQRVPEDLIMAEPELFMASLVGEAA